MNHKTLAVLILLSSNAVFAANAQPPQTANNETTAYTQMKDAALKAVFSETKMIGEYRHYRGDTKTYNYTEFHHEDGTSDYFEGASKEDGLWDIVGGDKVCYRYPKSKTHRRTYCFMVFENKGCYYKYSAYDMTPTGPRGWDLWSSRAVRAGSGKTCAEPIS